MLLIEDRGCWQLYRCKKCGDEFWVHGDFLIIQDTPSKRCKVYVVWSKEQTLVSQINSLKKLVPSVRTYTNSEILEIARTTNQWMIDKMYLSEAEDLVKRAKEQEVVLVLEEMEYEEGN